jgi:hypothetical protein
MRYSLFLVFLFVTTLTHAASPTTYWVVDKDVPSRGSFRELSEQDKIQLGSFYYSSAPEEVIDAMESKGCAFRYERLAKALLDFDKLNKNNLGNENVVLEREKLLSSDGMYIKNIKSCLKKEGASSKVETVSLEKRISAIELQIQKILKALRTLGATI